MFTAVTRLELPTRLTSAPLEGWWTSSVVPSDWEPSCRQAEQAQRQPFSFPTAASGYRCKTSRCSLPPLECKWGTSFDAAPVLGRATWGCLRRRWCRISLSHSKSHSTPTSPYGEFAGGDGFRSEPRAQLQAQVLVRATSGSNVHHLLQGPHKSPLAGIQHPMVLY